MSDSIMSFRPERVNPDPGRLRPYTSIAAIILRRAADDWCKAHRPHWASNVNVARRVDDHSYDFKITLGLLGNRPSMLLNVVVPANIIDGPDGVLEPYVKQLRVLIQLKAATL